MVASVQIVNLAVPHGLNEASSQAVVEAVLLMAARAHRIAPVPLTMAGHTDLAVQHGPFLEFGFWFLSVRSTPKSGGLGLFWTCRGPAAFW